MKKVIIILAIATEFTLFTGFIAHASEPTQAVQIETISGTVTGYDSEYTYVDLSDDDGWVLDYNSRLLTGDSVTLTIDTMGTADIYDDELVSIALMLEV